MSGRKILVHLPERLFRRLASSDETGPYARESLCLFLHLLFEMAKHGRGGMLPLKDKWPQMTRKLAQLFNFPEQTADSALRELVAGRLIENQVTKIHIPKWEELLGYADVRGEEPDTSDETGMREEHLKESERQLREREDTLIRRELALDMREARLNSILAEQITYELGEC